MLLNSLGVVVSLEKEIRLQKNEAGGSGITMIREDMRNIDSISHNSFLISRIIPFNNI